ncbi:MAG: hypothetical protein MUE44_08820 [Oscillatoriaceae cyanobacterium Prado104]|jgi:hypothetical protein|nr:hypothetical protein [Oscillatoriaceae cyanobacterium Prado104]
MLALIFYKNSNIAGRLLHLAVDLTRAVGRAIAQIFSAKKQQQNIYPQIYEDILG